MTQREDDPRPAPEPRSPLPTGPARAAAGADPDVRFTYANERTFLAWNRTALALVATGVAATQFLPKLQVTWGRRLLGIPLILLGALVAAESFRHWRANERAMREGTPLPRSAMPMVLAAGILIVGVAAAVLALLGSK
jgi:putative membrane protein